MSERGHEITTISAKHTSRAGYFYFSSIDVPLRLPSNSDIYHAMSPLEAIYLSKRKNAVVTFHDLIPMLYLELTKTHYAKGAVGRFITKRYFTFACRKAIKCRAIITNSKLTKEQIIEHLGADEDRIHITPFGINPRFRPIPKRDDIFRIGTLSYLDKRKRIDLLINAFREIETTTDDVELVIGGRGEDMGRLKSLAAGTSTKFLGFVPDERLCDFYNSLDVFVFPTLLEGQGLPMIEAMACGKPVVTLQDAIMPDEVKDRTIVTTPEKLTETLLGLKFRRKIKTKRENIRWAQAHRWGKTVGETIKVYGVLS